MPLKAPTPPTPPTIDKGDVQISEPRIDAHQFFEVPQMPFRKSATDENSKVDEVPAVEETPKVTEQPKVDETQQPTRQVTTPEDMARDAVAHGSGPLTKREITRANDDSPNNSTQNNSNINSTVTAPLPITPSNSDSYERGQAVLREFREADEGVAENSTSTSTSANFQAQNNSKGYGGIFWIVTLIFVVTATFFLAKKFLFKRKPKLKKSDLFLNSSDKLKSTAEKFSKPAKPVEKKSKPIETPKPIEKKSPTVKPARPLKKDDDDKGKHFEIRI